MFVCDRCRRHVRAGACPFCGKRTPRFNKAALVIGVSLTAGSGPMFDRVFGCNNETVVAPYGAPQPPTPDAAPPTLPDAGVDGK